MYNKKNRFLFIALCFEYSPFKRLMKMIIVNRKQISGIIKRYACNSFSIATVDAVTKAKEGARPHFLER